MKRILSVFLSLLMLCTLLPTTVLAEETVVTSPPIMTGYPDMVITSDDTHAMQRSWHHLPGADLSIFAGCTLYLEYDIKVESTHTNPAPANDDWIKYIVNGYVKINDVQVDALGYNRSVPSFTTAGEWTSFRVALPPTIAEMGIINRFQFLVYNDTGSKYTTSPEYVDNGIKWSNDHGVVFSLQNIRITADEQVTANFSKLCGYMTHASNTLNDGLVYTAETRAKLAAALETAKAISFKADQATVTAAEKGITNALSGLRHHCGDVNANGSITAEDALMALQISTSKISCWILNEYAGDVDGIDGVTASDALLILQYATKKLTQFPADAV